MQDPALQPILCLLGHPAAGNPMQLAMERAFVSAGLDWRYLTLDVSPDNLAPSLRGIQSLGFRGAHLSRPHPPLAIELIDSAMGSAAVAGWIDCVSLEKDQLVGHNRWGAALTDYLKNIFPEPKPRNALLLGSERGLLAMGAELALNGWDTIWVDGADLEAVAAINGRLHREAIKSHASRKRWPSGLHLLIQGTDPHGEAPKLDPTSLDRLAPDACVVDLSRPTAFSALTRAAQERGLHHLSGLEAMVQYAADTFYLWTGLRANLQVLHDTFEEYYEI